MRFVFETPIRTIYPVCSFCFAFFVGLRDTSDCWRFKASAGSKRQHVIFTATPLSSRWYLTGLMILIICLINYWKQQNPSAKVSLLASCFCFVFSQGGIKQESRSCFGDGKFLKEKKNVTKLALKMDRISGCWLQLVVEMWL